MSVNYSLDPAPFAGIRLFDLAPADGDIDRMMGKVLFAVRSSPIQIHGRIVSAVSRSPVLQILTDMAPVLLAPFLHVFFLCHFDS